MKKIKHIIQTKKGPKEVSLDLRLAVSYKCKECLGFCDNPINCTSPLCPLYPFRDKSSTISNPK